MAAVSYAEVGSAAAAKYRVDFLQLPAEIRFLVYKQIFANASVKIIAKRTEEVERRENETKNLNPWRVREGEEYNLVLTCKQCHHEARPLFCSLADFCFSGESSSHQISRLCSPSMSSNIKKLVGVTGLCFEDYDILNETFPRLETLHIVLPSVTKRRFGDIAPVLSMGLEAFVQAYVVKTQKQRELVDYLSKKARFDTIMRTYIMVDVFDCELGMSFRSMQILQMDLRKGTLVALGT